MNESYAETSLHATSFTLATVSSPYKSIDANEVRCDVTNLTCLICGGDLFFRVCVCCTHCVANDDEVRARVYIAITMIAPFVIVTNPLRNAGNFELRDVFPNKKKFRIKSRIGDVITRP